MLRCAITDRSRLAVGEPERIAALLEQAEQLAADGVDFLQLREKDLPAADVAALARKLLEVLRARAAAPRLLINSRADIAVATRADGVHLTASPGSLTPADVRRLYAAAGLAEPIVSVSCHSVDEVARARDSGATLILFGPVFEKRVGDAVVNQGSGVDLLRAACASAGATPVLALGGITLEGIPGCLAAGAAGVAAIRLFLPRLIA
jgi:thiamine-phosphate pyrophosphorylase